MKVGKFKILKQSILVLILVVTSIEMFAQKPTIGFVDKTKGANNDLITISGSSFGDDATKLIVSFGAVKGTVESASDKVIEVRVPSGTTFNSISVTHTDSGLTGYSNDPFLLSFNGAHGFENANLEGQKDFDAQTGLYDFCLCDFDGDTKSDMLATSEETGTVALFANTTTTTGINNITFAKTSFLLNARSLHAKCGDLNGDGKADVIISEAGNGDRIFILQNTSTGPGILSFSTAFVQLPGIKVKRLEIADLDQDGKPEIIVTNQKGSTVSILINLSTKSNVIFSNTSSTVITIPGVVNDRGFDGLAVADLNDDKKPDIVTTQFQRETDLFIIPNNSTPGNISMGEVKSLSLASTVVNLKIGDLDKDGKPDIAATLLLGKSVAIFRNEGSGSDFGFSTAVQVETDERPYGIDFGDLDGDGSIDIATGSITNKTLTILNNESSPGNISFKKLIEPTTFINRHIAIGDIDGDGKPDVTFTSIDDNNRNIPASKMSVLRNKHCMIPVLHPDGPLTICVGSSANLFSTPSLGTTYEWKNDNTTVVTSDEATLNVTTPGNFAVTTTSAADAACVATSNVVEVTFETGASLTGTASISAVDPICTGSTLQLHVSDVGGTEYKWTGPENYSAAGLAANPPITDFQPTNAGRYTVQVFAGTCLAQEASIVVAVLEAPAFQLNAGDTSIICDLSSKTLIISPQPDNFTFQWFEKNKGALAGETNVSLLVSEEGEYFVTATTSPACASGNSPSAKIFFSPAPKAVFTAPAIGCIDHAVIFVNESTFDNRFTPTYTWNFGDESASTDQNAEHQYTTANSFTAHLTISYHGTCADETSSVITIEAPPQVNIINEKNSFSLCPGGELTLSVQKEFSNYLWTTGETTPEVKITEIGIYGVMVTDINGCTGTVDQEVGLFQSPTVTITADPPSEIIEGQQAQLSATGLVNYAWTPQDHLSDFQSANTIATPTITTVYKVSGKDANGCEGEAEIEIKVKGELATKKIVPGKFFSPGNGDDINKSWLVEKILDYPNCDVSIYDDKGLKVFEAKPYLNDWDGTYNGKALPDGVYFYIIRCDGEEKAPKTGTITLLR
jgi:gliding motility-associated-like protein